MRMNVVNKFYKIKVNDKYVIISRKIVYYIEKLYARKRK